MFDEGVKLRTTCESFKCIWFGTYKYLFNKMSNYNFHQTLYLRGIGYKINARFQLNGKKRKHDLKNLIRYLYFRFLTHNELYIRFIIAIRFFIFKLSIFFSSKCSRKIIEIFFFCCINHVLSSYCGPIIR